MKAFSGMKELAYTIVFAAIIFFGITSIYGFIASIYS
jgi:hypothetical protein